ncbi:acyl-CoA synthetase [Halosegnis marinus]|uniref:Acyl-CoA synthetase n=2 Tax=Halosegnis marinus TaxID=3034023 RepID=A0ABD5ZKG9_9EURY|nr:AMP-binding protein [Halosegnis sp. DT85]
MAPTERLDAYRFHEREWGSYGELREAFEWELPDRFNMAAYVCDRWAAETPEALALVADDGDGTRTLTYADLDAAASALARHLRAEGVERGDRVGVNAPQRVETAVAHVACWKLGAVSVPLSTLFGPDAVEYRLADAGAVAAVVEGSAAEAFREARPACVESVVLVDGDPRGDETAYDEAVAGEEKSLDAVDTAAEDDALLIYTSGTTGNPKGVRHAHRMLLGHLPLFLTTFCNLDLRDGDTFHTPSEWAWIASLFDVVVPALYYGRTLVVDEAGGPFDAGRTFDLLDRHGVTHFFAPPTALRVMMTLEAEAERVRVVASGGESLGPSVATWAADAFGGAVVHEGYGQTEANMVAGDCTALAESREGYIGLAGPGHDLAIVDPDTAETTVPPGEVGEIAVRYEGDPVCFVEYWNEPEKTAAKVRNGWLLTEDLGRMDADGYLAFEARKDDVIISAGYRIGPVEIEESLAGHPAVADAAVVGVPDDERGEVPKAFVVLAEGWEPTEATREALREHVRERLAKYEYPRDIAFRESLPTTATGKVRRASLTDE